MAAAITAEQERRQPSLVEPNAAPAVQLVDYVHVLEKGRVVYSAAPQELWSNDAVKSSFLGI